MNSLQKAREDQRCYKNPRGCTGDTGAGGSEDAKKSQYETIKGFLSICEQRCVCIMACTGKSEYSFRS